MAHTEEKNYTAVQGEIMDWVAANSWVNIINWKNWVVGTTDNPEQAESTLVEDLQQKPLYFKAFDAGSNEEASRLAEIYISQGSETFGPDEITPGQYVYFFKTFI